jgi:hypothetical protein
VTAAGAEHISDAVYQAPFVSPEVHEKIKREMDAAFDKNLAKSKADREARMQAREKQETQMTTEGRANEFCDRSSSPTRLPEAVREAPAEEPLTHERRAQLEAQAHRLIVQLKRGLRRQDLLKLGDIGNVGVPHIVFTRGWDGVTLNAPSLSVPSTDPLVSPAQHAEVKEQMDAAFHKNIAKSRADRLATRRASPELLAKIDAEMDAAFRKNVAKSKAEREARKQARRPNDVGDAMAESPELRELKARLPAVIGTLEDQSEPVTPDNPLVGLETEVLKVWLENSPALTRLHKTDPLRVETAVRQAVDAALDQELMLRAQGLPIHEAQEQTRPVIWKPPKLRAT